MKYVLALLILAPQLTFASSNETFPFAKAHLLGLLEKSSELDIKDAQNGSRLSDINLKSLKDRISHIENGEMNLQNLKESHHGINPAELKAMQVEIINHISVRPFAERLVNILHGSLKVSFTQKEKIHSLKQAFSHETKENVNVSSLAHTEMNCRKINLHADSALDETLNLDLSENNESLYRWTEDQYLLIETSEKTEITHYRVCHASEDKLNFYQERFIRPYFTNSNLESSYDGSTLPVFQSLIIQDTRFLGDAFKKNLNVSISNLNQLIYNIDYKIKVQMIDVYETLTTKRYSYSEAQDSEAMDRLTQALDEGLTTNSKPSHTIINEKMLHLEKEIQGLADPARKTEMKRYFDDFTVGFLTISEDADKIESNVYTNIQDCDVHKNVGDFYSCQIELEKVEAQEKLKAYESLKTDMDKLVEQFTNWASVLSFSDESAPEDQFLQEEQ